MGLDTFLMQYIESEHSVLINNNRLVFTVKLEQYRGHAGGLSVGYHQDKVRLVSDFCPSSAGGLEVGYVSEFVNCRILVCIQFTIG